MPTGTPTRSKICPLCGDEFVPEKPSSRYCKKDHFQPCPVCGKPVLWNSKKPVPACSKECKRELRKMHNREKWGVDHPMQLDSVKEKHRESMLERYGVESPLQSEEIKARAVESNLKKFGSTWALGNKEFHDKCQDSMQEKYGGRTTFQSPILMKKIKETNIKKYGAQNPLQNNEVRERVEQTCLRIYGAKYPTQNEDVIKRSVETRKNNNGGVFWTDEMRKKSENTSLMRYGVSNPSKSEEVKETIRKSCMEKYGVPYGCMVEGAKPHRISKINRSFAAKLSGLSLDCELEFRIKNKYYDIGIPSIKTVIEIDPSYTHNTEGANHFHRKISEQYHLEKTLIAERNGYRCIHVFDWDDWEKIANLIAPTKRIYARNCGIVKIINQSVANKFINENHLQGQARGSILTLGLTYEGELVEAMSFGRSRYDKKHTYELLRLCSKQGTTVVGGASKLFKFATDRLDLDDIVSYCDRSKFNGVVYEKIGMKLIRETKPNIVWSRNSDKITSNLLRQRGYDQLFKTNYGKGTDNDILMLVNGWVPVPDCGQKVFSYRSNL